MIGKNKIIFDNGRRHPFGRYFSMMKQWLWVVLLAVGQGLCAQKSDPLDPRVERITLYYDNGWKLTSPEKSVFRREAQFDLVNIWFDGDYQDYDANGNRVGEGFYVKGVRSGFQYEYFPSHQLHTSTEVNGQDFVIWEERTEDGKSTVQAGTGKFTRMYFFTQVGGQWKQGVLEGEFFRGRREGHWLYRSLQGKQTDSEWYRNGRLMVRWHYEGVDSVRLATRTPIVLSSWSLYTDQMSLVETYSSLPVYFQQHVTYPKGFQREVTVMGGWKSWLKKVALEAGLEPSELVVVRLNVDETGMVRDVDLESPYGDEQDKKVLKAVTASMTQFFPAIRNGSPMASVLYVPVSGGVAWQEFIDQSSFSTLQSLR